MPDMKIKLGLSNSVNVGKLGVLGGGVAAPQATILLLDRFVTDEVAPMATPRTCEPGPGTLVKTDSGNKCSISSGILSVSSATGSNDPRWVSSSAFTKAIGLFAMGSYKNGGGLPDFGFGSSGVVGSTAMFYTTNLFTSTHDDNAIGTWNDALYYKRCIIYQSDRFIFLAKGNVFTDWSIVGVWPGTYQNEKLLFGNYASSNPSFDFVAVGQLPAPYTTDYAISTVSSATTTDGQTATSSANAIDEHTIIAQAGVTQSFWFRRTTDDECWRIDMDQAGGTIKLYKRTGGVDTEVDPGRTQTWTAGNSYRVVAEHVGNAINVYVAGTKKNRTTDAFNSAATGVKVSNAGSKLICWPYAVSADLIAILDAVG